MLTAEQIAAAHKANLETLFGLTNKAFESMEKIVELNMAAAKAAMNDVAESAQAALDAKDVQELLAVQARLVQPMAEKTAAYSRHLYEIASQAGADLGKQLEAQTGETQKKVMGLVDNVAQNAPAGSETAVAMLKSSMAAASNAFESVQKVMKQASEMTQANLRTVSETATANVKKASTSRKR